MSENKLSERMHKVMWGPWVDDPIEKENEMHEWLRQVCSLEKEFEEACNDLAHYKKTARRYKETIELMMESIVPIAQFSKEQWRVLLEYLPDGDYPEYDVLRKFLYETVEIWGPSVASQESNTKGV